jgi:hypothetical protein
MAVQERIMQKSQTSWASLFLWLSVLFGAVVRFAPTVISGSPINDGGMFYIMIEDLKANRFLLPSFTSYNHLNIPFMYPPLSFYIGGLLSLSGIPTFEVLRWLPPLVSTFSILAFYWMASLMLDSRTKAALAAVAYALMPRSFSWYIMGGGLSRTFGVLFLLLASASAWVLFTQRVPKYLFLTMLFGAGAVLSHPETGLHTAASCALIWLFKAHNARGVRDAVVVAFGVLVLASPWWGIALNQHGLAPLQSALNTGGHNALFWLPWITLDFAEERFVTLFTFLGLIGFTVQCIRRDWFLPAWMLAPFIVEPRSATAIAALPLAILAGLGLSDLFLPNIAALASKPAGRVRDWTSYMSNSRAVRIVLGCILFYALLGAFFYDISLTNYVVSVEDRAAMQWVRMNTPPGSRFIVLTGKTDPFSDPVAEWFPALANRTSQNTIQGKEWLLGKEFMPFLDEVKTLQLCLNTSPACVENWSEIEHLDFDYLYVVASKGKDAPPISGFLSYQLQQDEDYSLVFENGGVAIFERK